MNLLRTIAALAWSDGHLALEEVDLMLDRFSGLFATGPVEQQALQQELRDYLAQNIPLEELVPKLASQEERELVLQLGCEVISTSSRTPDEPSVNAEEAEAYQRLVELLDLPPDAVKRLKAEADAQPARAAGLVDRLVTKIEQFIKG